MFTPVPNPTTNPAPAKFGDQDLIRRSASTVTPPAKRQTEVAKLIDVSKCIGCKACQVACLEWNNLTEEVGVNVGVYDNPHDLTANTWTLMRYTEYENAESGNLEWLIRKDGCMHCEDPGCLKACPAPGAIVQYSNGIVDFDQNMVACLDACLSEPLALQPYLRRAVGQPVPDGVEVADLAHGQEPCAAA